MFAFLIVTLSLTGLLMLFNAFVFMTPDEDFAGGTAIINFLVLIPIIIAQALALGYM